MPTIRPAAFCSGRRCARATLACSSESISGASANARHEQAKARRKCDTRGRVRFPMRRRNWRPEASDRSPRRQPRSSLTRSKYPEAAALVDPFAETITRSKRTHRDPEKLARDFAACFATSLLRVIWNEQLDRLTTLASPNGCSCLDRRTRAAYVPATAGPAITLQ